MLSTHTELCTYLAAIAERVKTDSSCLDWLDAILICEGDPSELENHPDLCKNLLFMTRCIEINTVYLEFVHPSIFTEELVESVLNAKDSEQWDSSRKWVEFTASKISNDKIANMCYNALNNWRCSPVSDDDVY